MMESRNGNIYRLMRYSVLGLILVSGAMAGNRRFGYSYEATTMPQGTMELETLLTWKTDKDSDADFERLDVRHEFEYGLSDRLQLAFYLDWRHGEAGGKSASTEFRDVAVEVIYNLRDPNSETFGTALYGEIKGSDDFVELEAKVLFQKNYDQWIFVYNVGAEIEWEHDYRDDKAALMQSAGASYQLSPAFSLGAEILHELSIPDVEDFGDNVVYLGPNMAWQDGRFAVALAGLWQVTSLSDEPNFQLRTIFSVHF